MSRSPRSRAEPELDFELEVLCAAGKYGLDGEKFLGGVDGDGPRAVAAAVIAINSFCKFVAFRLYSDL